MLCLRQIIHFSGPGLCDTLVNLRLKISDAVFCELLERVKAACECLLVSEVRYHRHNVVLTKETLLVFKPRVELFSLKRSLFGLNLRLVLIMLNQYSIVHLRIELSDQLGEHLVEVLINLLHIVDQRSHFAEELLA